MSLDGNTPVNGAAPLAPGKESGIIREDGKWLPSGAVMTLPGIGNVPFRALAFAAWASAIFEANNRIPRQDFRRAMFAKLLQYFEYIGPEYAQRARAEIDAILSIAPFED